ncbi:hypothetical protein DPMN_106490 [Dreissena polymorpha]|uniref:Uncharacterized protein n=1 Tax=Dreissena polymorpha TaxID=45954 RepID=A0A9D4K5A1_DREPO|nr:hypothetical protein DPMN_106490 [Dreissena polymorpha]
MHRNMSQVSHTKNGSTPNRTSIETTCFGSLVKSFPIRYQVMQGFVRRKGCSCPDCRMRRLALNYAGQKWHKNYLSLANLTWFPGVNCILILQCRAYVEFFPLN